MKYTANKSCTLYLGVYIAEQVLARAFEDVEVMPLGNVGFDFRCNNGKLVDLKAACFGKRGSWTFNIKRNLIADHFLCIAFNNRKDLKPLHAWFLPGHTFNKFRGVSISPSTIHKWDMYRLDLSKISASCEQVRKNPIEVPRPNHANEDDIGHPMTVERKERKTRLCEYIKKNGRHVKKDKLLALFCVEEGVSMATVHIYIQELLNDRRIRQIDDTLQGGVTVAYSK